MLRHVLQSQQFSRPFLMDLFTHTTAIREDMSTREGRAKLRQILAGELMFALFYEPSTRTRFSFISAAQHLGMRADWSENAREFSSAVKGERLEHTIQVMCQYYPSVIVMRHHDDGAAHRAASVSTVPIINGGDGRGQHPTQAMLDLYTIYHKLGRLDDLTVVIGGDLANGRTVRSLAYLLSKFDNNRLIFVAPEELQIGEDIKEHLREHNIAFELTDNLADVLPRADAVYWTRIQFERVGEELRKRLRTNRMIITQSELNLMKSDAILHHPMPIDQEISSEVDEDPRAVYIPATGFGMCLRMALLIWMLKH